MMGGWGPYISGMPMQSPQPENALSDIEVPLYIEPFKAWRCWTVSVEKDHSVSLRSITYKIRWPRSKAMRAHCLYQWRKGRNIESAPNSNNQRMVELYGKHTAPHLKHGCGIYSTRERKDTGLWAVNSATTELRVVGEVKLWGKALCFEKGFVSEFAYPTSIFVDPQSWKRLSKHHQVDITPYELMNALSASYDVPVIVEGT